eukprot:3737744-Pleurochrysis_carterae.AAC.1
MPPPALPTSCSRAWSSRAPSPSSCRPRRDGRAAAQGTRSAATRRHRRCSSSRRRPRTAACRPGAYAPGSASRTPP